VPPGGPCYFYVLIQLVRVPVTDDVCRNPAETRHVNATVDDVTTTLTGLRPQHLYLIAVSSVSAARTQSSIVWLRLTTERGPLSGGAVAALFVAVVVMIVLMVAALACLVRCTLICRMMKTSFVFRVVLYFDSVASFSFFTVLDIHLSFTVC